MSTGTTASGAATAASFAATGALTGATLTITGAAPWAAGLRELDCLHGHKRSVDGQRGLRRRDPRQRACGCWATRACGSSWSKTAERTSASSSHHDQQQGAGESLDAAVPDHEPEDLVIAGNTGNVVCNTSFTDLSDSRVKTEIAEADAAAAV